jgi:hypothetical protein
MAEGDAGFAEVVGGHLDVDAVANADTDEILAHFARNVGQHFVAVGQRDTKHGTRQHLGHRARHFDWFFFGQAITETVQVVLIVANVPALTMADNSILWRRTMRWLPGKIKQLLVTKYVGTFPTVL